MLLKHGVDRRHLKTDLYPPAGRPGDRALTHPLSRKRTVSCLRKWPLFVGLLAVFSSVALPAVAERLSRLSAIVTFEYDGEPVASFLEQPALSFIEAHVYFTEDLDDSVLFGIDQEFLEGTADPIWVSSGDWMAFVGLQRTGLVWLAAGTPEMLAGEPADERNWVTIPLGVSLSPDTWYRLHSVADFGNRRFVSFTIEGPDIDRTLDLSAYALDYPNAIPFSDRALTYYVWSANAVPFGGSADREASVYFDDVRYGIVQADGASGPVEQTIRNHDFDTAEPAFLEQPVPFLAALFGLDLDLTLWRQGAWYLEREEALADPVRVPFARSGTHVAETDASLSDIDIETWREGLNR